MTSGSDGGDDEVGRLRRLLAERDAELRALRDGSVRSEVPVAASLPAHARDELLRAVFDGSLDALLLADDDGVYVDANPAACRMFGLPREQLIGRRILDFADTASTSTRATRASWDAFHRAGTLRGEFLLVRPDGERRTVEFQAASNILPGLHLSALRDLSELRRSQASFLAMLERNRDVVARMDRSGVLRFVSRGVEAVLGCAPEQMVGKDRRLFVHPPDHEVLARMNETLVKGGLGTTTTEELRLVHVDRTPRWVECTSTNLLDDPDVDAIVLNFRDITERKAADQGLRDAALFLEESQALAHVGGWVAGLVNDEDLVLSKETQRIFGIADDSGLPVSSFWGFVHADDVERVRGEADVAIATGAPCDVQHRIVRTDGQVRWVHQRAVVERDPSGLPTRMVGVIQDITDQRRGSDALRASEERYRRIIESTNEGVWTSDLDGVTTFMNQRMADMLGYRLDELVGRPALAFLSPEQVTALQLRATRRRKGLADRYDFGFIRKDGSPLWARVNANPLIDEQGRPTGSIALVSDVSAQRKEEEMRTRLAAVVDSSADAIYSTDIAGVVTSWNGAAARLYGHTAAEMIGQAIAVIIPDEASDEHRALAARVLAGDVATIETIRRRKDGTQLAVSLSMAPLRDLEGVVVGVSRIARDLSERRAIEERLRQAAKMDAIGNLAGGVAHDFNNLLTVILGNAWLLHAELEPGTQREDVQGILDAGNRGVGLTRQLLAFTRRQVVQPRILDLNVIVNGVSGLLRRLLGADAELVLELAPGLGKVRADPGQIEQVILNLAVNARDALPAGGAITITTRNVVDTGDGANGSGANGSGVSVGAVRVVGPAIELGVKDTGCGMDADTLAHIFEPFFTTKEAGKGTGLGLATVVAVVEQSGGRVEVVSTPDQGSLFRVLLPRDASAGDDDAAEVVAAEARDRPLRGGTETVLVLDDDDDVRQLIATVLRRQGYQVLEAGNGGEALLISEQHRHIDLLIADVVLPRLGGREVAGRLRPLQPKMRVLFMSGYADDAVLRRGVTGDGLHFLQKPITPPELTEKVREILDAHRDPPPRLDRSRLLLVHQDPLVLETLRRVLRHDPFELLSARDADEAVDVIERNDIDIVIADGGQHGADARGFFAMLGEHRAARVLMVSKGPAAAVAAEDLRLRRIDAIVEKPWDNGELKALLTRLR